MAKKVQSVEEFLGKLKHPRLEEIRAVRAIVLKSAPGITEQVKWNAPSFCIQGDDRVTMRLQPGNIVGLVFHRGAKVKDTRGFKFKDDSGLLEFVAGDRAVVAFESLKDIKAKRGALAKAVGAWIKATS
jgi:hypothetical protein